MRCCLGELCQHQQSGVRATSAHRTLQTQPGHLRWRASRTRGCLEALRDTAERLVGDFGTQDFTNTAWAFAVASQSDAWLYEWALPESAERWAGDFSTPDFTITAGAFSVAGQSDALLFRGTAGISRAVGERPQLTRLHQHSMGMYVGGQSDACCLELCPIVQSGVWATSDRRTFPTRHGHLAVANQSDALLFGGSAGISRAVCSGMPVGCVAV